MLYDGCECYSSELWCTSISDAAVCLCHATPSTGFVFGGLVNGSLLVIEVQLLLILAALYDLAHKRLDQSTIGAI